MPKSKNGGGFRMAKVTSILAARSKQIREGDFAEAIEARGRDVKAEVAAATCADIHGLTLPDIRISADAQKLGYVGVISQRTFEPVIADEGFPRILRQIPEIAGREIVFAADYVLAYALAVKALNRRSVRVTQPLEETIWPEAYRNLDVPHRFEIPYRFAASIALSSQGIDPLVMPPQVPESGLPPHLASLFDPYSDHTMRLFGDAMSYTMNAQRRNERGPIC